MSAPAAIVQVGQRRLVDTLVYQVVSLTSPWTAWPVLLIGVCPSKSYRVERVEFFTQPGVRPIPEHGGAEEARR